MTETRAGISLGDVSAGTRQSMRSNRSKDTDPELRLRQALRAAGLVGYRVHVATLPGRPDIVFPKWRVVVDVRGCFWHMCPWCQAKRNLRPATNAAYWHDKRIRTQARDRAASAALEAMGYSV